MAEFLATLQSLFTFAFVVSSMLAMGLSLTVPQILQPLSNLRLVLLALLANFVIVPATAYFLAQVIPMNDQLQIGLILMGSAAGAPFLPKLAQIAKANVPFSVGLMALLIVVTVVYLPIVLPLLLPGVEVDAGKIALTLFGEMLVPLAIGLVVRARWVEAAGELQKPAAQVSNLSLVLLLVLMLGLNIENVIGLFGSGALLATLVMVASRSAPATCSVARAATRARCWPWAPDNGISPPRSSSPAATSPINRTCSSFWRAPG